MSGKLFLVILILILAIYLQYYLKYNNTYRIIQSDINKIDANVLYERYPIVVSDRLVDPNDLLKTLFKYTYLFKVTHIQHGDIHPTLCINKYTLIYNNKDDIDINIILPSYRKEFKYKYQKNIFKADKSLDSTNIQYVTIKLKKQQILILPAFWIYQTNTPHHSICLNDPFTLLINFFYLWAV